VQLSAVLALDLIQLRAVLAVRELRRYAGDDDDDNNNDDDDVMMGITRAR
jgi:hypothetical protein